MVIANQGFRHYHCTTNGFNYIARYLTFNSIQLTTFLNIFLSLPLIVSCVVDVEKKNVRTKKSIPVHRKSKCRRRLDFFSTATSEVNPAASTCKLQTAVTECGTYLFFFLSFFLEAQDYTCR